MPTKFKDIVHAFEFANTGGDIAEFRAFVCRQTGTIYSDTGGFDSGEEDEDELPDDIEDATKYVPLPDKRELDLGKSLVMAFARQELPDDLDDVRSFFSKRGGYSKFKALLAHRGAIDRWHRFENEATEQALRAWCTDNEIEITE